MNMVTVGVLGTSWRAGVTPWGALEQWDGLGTLDWFVAADDRWYRPAGEATIRQTTVDGTPVVETRMRIPKGDAVQRVYAVPDHGGLTIIEIENDSPLPIAVAFTGTPVLSVRQPTTVPIEGIELGADAVSFPVGHHATVVVAIAHEPGVLTALPATVPTATQVARGWLATVERASRLVLPDAAVAAAVVRERCELLLGGPADPADDAVEFLLGVGELVRMGMPAQPWVDEVADAVAALVGHSHDPHLVAALDAAERVCRAAGEDRAARDLERLRDRVPRGAQRTNESPAASGARVVAEAEAIIAAGPDLFPSGLPDTWLGQQLEVYNVPTGATSAVSFAVRWHGERPAVLWECTGTSVALRSSVLAPNWSSDAPTGDALWPAQAIPAGMAAASNLSIGNLSTGDLSGSDLSAGDLSGGDISFG